MNMNLTIVKWNVHCFFFEGDWENKVENKSTVTISGLNKKFDANVITRKVDACGLIIVMPKQGQFYLTYLDCLTMVDAYWKPVCL